MFTAWGIVSIVALYAILALLFVLSFYLIFLYAQKLTINEEGITSKVLFFKKKILWYELQDMGISFYSFARYVGPIYFLYFSKTVQKDKNEYKKKLRGKMIAVVILGTERQMILDTVIPYCQKRTTVVPFIGKRK